MSTNLDIDKCPSLMHNNVQTTESDFRGGNMLNRCRLGCKMGGSEHAPEMDGHIGESQIAQHRSSSTVECGHVVLM
jgi:hypothetical protein